MTNPNDNAYPHTDGTHGLTKREDIAKHIAAGLAANSELVKLLSNDTPNAMRKRIADEAKKDLAELARLKAKYEGKGT